MPRVASLRLPSNGLLFKSEPRTTKPFVTSSSVTTGATAIKTGFPSSVMSPEAVFASRSDGVRGDCFAK